MNTNKTIEKLSVLIREHDFWKQQRDSLEEEAICYLYGDEEHETQNETSENYYVAGNVELTLKPEEKKRINVLLSTLDNEIDGAWSAIDNFLREYKFKKP